MGQAVARVRPEASLKQSWANLRNHDPQIHARDAAWQLGVSEAQLAATGCGETAIRLTNDWHAPVNCLRLLGRVLAVTRNEHAVLQRQGTYSDLRVTGDGCRMQGEQIDLSLLLKRWRYGFAVREATVSGTRRSLQFFDCAGHAVHKAYLTDDSDLGAYHTFINTYSSADQGAIEDMARDRQVRMEMPDARVDVAGLRTHWDRLIDARAFSALLNRFGVTRLQALRLAGSPRALQVASSSLRTVLEKISEIGLPIRIKVCNPGACQTYTGPIHNLRAIGKWYSVLDPDFNLHVHEAAVHSKAHRRGTNNRYGHVVRAVRCVRRADCTRAGQTQAGHT